MEKRDEQMKKTEQRNEQRWTEGIEDRREKWTEKKCSQKGQMDRKEQWTDEKDGQKGERLTEERYARKR